MNEQLELYVPTVLALCRGDPDCIRDLMEMSIAAAIAQADAPRQPQPAGDLPGDLLPNAAMAIAIGTTTGNLNQHKDPIKQFLKAKGLRSHPNADDRKIPTGKPGRRADGFTSQEIQAVAYQINTIGTLMEAFPPGRRHKAGRKRHT